MSLLDLRHAPPRRIVVGAGVTWVFVVLVVILVFRAEFIDLQVYRSGVDALVCGRDMYGELPPTSAGIRLPYIYPPFSALALAPFAAVPWPLAVVATVVLSVAALLVTVFLVARHGVGLTECTAMLTAAAVAPAALVLEPVRATIGFGQVNLWLMALVVADCLCPVSRLPRGVLVGLAAAIKVTPAAFLLFFLVRKDFRAARTAVVTGAAASAAGFLIAPQASWHYWTSELFGASGLAGSPFATNQSIPALSHRLGLPPVPSALALVLLAAAVLAAAIVLPRRTDALTGMIVTAAAALLLAPISWSHHWVWVVPALIALLGNAPTPRRVIAFAAVYLVALVGPYRLVPAGEDRELRWTPWQLLPGNGFLLPTLAVLLAAAGYSSLSGWRASRERLRL